ncbi:protein NIM1-INTERACTING 3 isoform X2 [Benincasa hispida]|uniref:protein NIM1-INTERACTING 3 isoform X2 n=1 Tax=Benincasa hispida TaxID=102211 RepID=UPI0019007141|nr:protein NIM1-INTERACTING 3 isoform X2 [Benincasa hispida]
MERGRKRRKLEEEEEEDDDEEGEMKLVFALIQNIKAMRGRMKSKESPEEEKSKGVWNPKFQPEDFIEDGYYNNKSNITLQLPAASSSTTKHSNPKKEQQEQQDKHKSTLETT